MCIEQAKAEIDKLSRVEMCRLHRFAPSGHPYFVPGPLHKHFSERLRRLGGFSSEISKEIGWQK